MQNNIPIIGRCSGPGFTHIVTFDTGLPRIGESLIIEGIQYMIKDIHRGVYKQSNGGWFNQSIVIILK